MMTKKLFLIFGMLLGCHGLTLWAPQVNDGEASSSSCSGSNCSSSYEESPAQDAQICAICLEKQETFEQYPCRHQFCLDCVSKLLLSNNFLCPYCRRPILQEKLPDMRWLQQDYQATEEPWEQDEIRLQVMQKAEAIRNKIILFFSHQEEIKQRLALFRPKKELWQMSFKEQLAYFREERQRNDALFREAQQREFIKREEQREWDIARLNEFWQQGITQLREERQRDITQLEEKREGNIAQLRKERQRDIAQLEEKRERHYEKLEKDRKEFAEEFFKDLAQSRLDRNKRTDDWIMQRNFVSTEWSAREKVEDSEVAEWEALEAIMEKEWRSWRVTGLRFRQACTWKSAKENSNAAWCGACGIAAGVYGAATAKWAWPWKKKPVADDDGSMLDDAPAPFATLANLELNDTLGN